MVQIEPLLEGLGMSDRVMMLQWQNGVGVGGSKCGKGARTTFDPRF